MAQEKRGYWLDLFTAKTWEEFHKAGGNVSGFRIRRRKMMQGIKQGDYFLCYLTGVSRWIGILEVISGPFKDTKKIWSDEDFPIRFNVKTIVALTPETAVPVLDLKNGLSFFKNLKNPNAWSGYFRGSPKRISREDGEAIERSIVDAKANPKVKPVDPAKLAYRPKAIKSKTLGPVTIPEPEPPIATAQEVALETSDHTEIQWLLLKLGNDMGLDVWVAKNDKNKNYKGNKFNDLPRIKTKLPALFEEVAQRTIELIDVLWLKGNNIQAAFEVENTTSIYSGLLRMSDLIATIPNLKIPLYLVAPDERRGKVFTEINRPTFSKMSPPLNELCQYIPFDALRKEAVEASKYIKHLSPNFLEDIAESCVVAEEL